MIGMFNLPGEQTLRMRLLVISVKGRLFEQLYPGWVGYMAPEEGAKAAKRTDNTGSHGMTFPVKPPPLENPAARSRPVSIQ